MKTSYKHLLITTLFIAGLIPFNSYSQDSTAIKKMLSEITFGVPSSPAFELLPNKPSEVTHLTSASDIIAHVNNFINGGKLQTGAAFDIRPFAYNIGSLTEYQKKPGKQILWRSVLSVGTASESQSNSDVYIGAGLRIPLIDKGDLRANPVYTELVESYKLLSMGVQPEPDFGETSAHYQARVKSLKDIYKMKQKRDSLFLSKWNAFRVDFGVGASSRAASGLLKSDSLFRDRIGLWLATGVRLTKSGQLTISANSAWINARTDTNENNRSIIGARARFFFGENFALSAEYARIYSDHPNRLLNENWGHLGIAAEFKMPLLGGWGGLAYGGDSAHRNDSKAKFTFNYAFYTDRIIKK